MSAGPRQTATSIRPPDIPKKLDPLDLLGGLTDHAQYRAVLLTDQNLAGQSAEYVSVESARLRAVNLSNTHLTAAQFSDVAFEHVSLAAADWARSIFHRCVWRDCGLTGVSATHAHLRDVLFTECSLTAARFRFATFKAARFESCILAEADFQGADLRGVRFVACDLRAAQMSGANLAGADLRGCNLDGLRIGPAELRGAIVDPTQAVALARLLGLTVAWPDIGGDTRAEPRDASGM
jgi:uncharacterized protein YjbI with pentapeptide repeats